MACATRHGRLRCWSNTRGVRIASLCVECTACAKRCGPARDNRWPPPRAGESTTTRKPRDRRPEMVGGGEALQPALYGLAAERALEEHVSMGRLWYATVARNYEIIDVGLNEWARRRAMTVLDRIDGAITGGFLPAAPR